MASAGVVRVCVARGSWARRVSVQQIPAPVSRSARRDPVCVPTRAHVSVGGVGVKTGKW